MAQNRFIAWGAVPDGSVLGIKVTGSDGNFQATAVQVEEPGGVKTISHPTLVAGLQQALSTPISYVTTVTISFLGEEETTVTVQGTVTKPDGTPFGAPRPPHEAEGKKDDQDTVMVLAATIKGEG